MRRTGIFLCFLILPALTCIAQRRGDRKLITPEEIRSQSLQEYFHFLASSKVLDSASNKDAEMVHKVAEKVFDAVKTYYARKKQSVLLRDMTWDIRVVSKKEVNAFCLPGVRMVIGTGMLDWAQNEGSLAVVMAHEIAHTLLDHGEQRLEYSLQELMGGKKMSELFSTRASDARDLFLASFGAGNIVGLLPPYRPADEKEADRLGMIFTGLAGYNPRESIVFWERMGRLSRGPRQPVLMSDHPYTEDRNAAMQEQVDDIVKTWYKPPGKG
jgi:predicted Zn-dependent protease